jgi:hypothetical protein
MIRLDGMIEMTAVRCIWRPRDMASTLFYIRVEGANLRLSIDIEREVSTIKRAGLPSLGRDRRGPVLTGGSP